MRTYAPFYNVVILLAEFGCSDEIATIIAMLQIQDVFITPPGPQRHKAVSLLDITTNMISLQLQISIFGQNSCQNLIKIL